MPKKNLLGQKFGRLTVIEETNERKNQKIVWKCQCDCGKITYVISSSLINGRSKSCGCLKNEVNSNNKKAKIVGHKFGKLLVIEDSTKRQCGKVLWKCKCDCGNIAYFTTNDLNSNKVQSCGCLKKENFSQLTKTNLLGKKFGKLTVIEETEERKNGCILWKCKCDCGNECYVDTSHLTSLMTKSCGCLKNSFGEYKIEQLLKENNILFQKEKTFEQCYFKNSNKKARFDFYINNSYLIEFDGKQHFYPCKFGNISDEEVLEQFKKTQIHDEYKNQWCKDNNIPLIRIPYTHLKDICLEDLLLETSKFIIN